MNNQDLGLYGLDISNISIGRIEVISKNPNSNNENDDWKSLIIQINNFISSILS